MHTTRVSLLQRLRSPDDPSAWPEFVGIYAPLLGEFGRRLHIPDADAVDLIQEIFALLLRRMQTFEHNHTKKFRGYLWTCFLHLSKRWYRERHAACPLELEVADEDHPAMEEAEFQAFVMARAMQVMKRRFEQSVWMAFVEFKLNGRSAREVEQLLGIPQANVWTYSSRVLAALREELEGLLD